MKGKWEEPWDFTKRSTLQSPVAYHTFIHSNIHTAHTTQHVYSQAHWHTNKKTQCKKHGIVLYSRQDAHYHYELWELCILSHQMHYIVYLFVRLVEKILRHCIMHFFVIVCERETEMSCL